MIIKTICDAIFEETKGLYEYLINKIDDLMEAYSNE